MIARHAQKNAPCPVSEAGGAIFQRLAYRAVFRYFPLAESESFSSPILIP